MIKEGMLSRLDETAMMEVNCDIDSKRLPGDIFLDKSQQYSFTLELILSTALPGENHCMSAHV